ncbi:MAG: NADPH-dependent F420 reductase [Deltaproteobacteria bacterium]|nr:NADPH-dependent F420 reductase [Deltaproteobacteria bacterium]
MKITFIGAGRVGAPLASRLAASGHDVVLAESRAGSDSVASALARDPRLASSPLRDAVARADVVFLTTPFSANAEVLGAVADRLVGKVLVDCTNPVGPGLSHGLGGARSGSAVVQELAPGARVVKAFTIYGFENLEDPIFPDYDLRPAMLFCGDDPAAKSDVARLIAACGFEPVDVGGLVQALHLEHMTLLWIRMVRAGGASPHLVWGALRRPRPTGGDDGR